MSEKAVLEEQLIKQLKNNAASECNTQEVLTTLQNLKNCVVKEATSRKCCLRTECLPNLIQLLLHENEEVYSLALRLIGYSYLNVRDVEHLSTSRIIAVILIIMHAYDEYNIHYYCCRVLGNFIEHQRVVPSESDVEEIEKSMVNCLRNCLSETTQLMAIRCLYVLFQSVPHKHRKLMLLSSVVDILCQCLKSKSKVIVTKACCLICLIARTHGTELVVQMNKRLSALIGNLEQSGVARKLILSLSYYIGSHPGLIQNGVVERLIDCLTKSDLSTMQDVCLAVTLCWFCVLPVGRARVREAPSGLCTILQMIQSIQYIYRKCGLVIIRMFMRSEASMKFLVANNLLPLLINFISDIVIHEAAEKNMRELSENGCIREWAMNDRMRTVKFENNIQNSFLGDGAPLVSSEYPDSSDYSSSEEGSECSDDDDEYNDRLLPFSEDLIPDPIELKWPLDVSTLNDDVLVFDVIRKLTFHTTPVKEFSLERVWSTLIDCLLLGVLPRTVISVLRSICKEPQFFHALLRSGFPLVVHRRGGRPLHDGCSRCSALKEGVNSVFNELATVGQSSYGKAIFCTELARGNDELKLIAALNVSHICNVQDDIVEFVLRHRLLDILCQNLNKNNMTADITSALHTLALHLKVSDPLLDYRNTVKEEHLHPLENNSEDVVICFQFDDERVLSFNKDVIVNASPVLAAMISGNFVESGQSIIKLKGVLSESFEMLVKAVNYKCACFFKGVPSSVLLESLVIADKFMFNNIHTSLLNAVIAISLSENTCLAVYEWYQSVGKLLYIEEECSKVIVKYILVSSMPYPQRLQLFTDILKSKYASAIIGMIKSVLICRCKDIGVSTDRLRIKRLKFS